MVRKLRYLVTVETSIFYKLPDTRAVEGEGLKRARDIARLRARELKNIVGRLAHCFSLYLQSR